MFFISRYVGRLFVKSFGKPVEILTKLNEFAGFAPDEAIELFEVHYNASMLAHVTQIKLYVLSFVT